MPEPWGNRTSWNSRELTPYWHYLIAKDFQSDAKEPAAFVPGHPLTWNQDEVDTIPCKQAVKSISLNADATLLALAMAKEIHIHRTSDRQQVQVLKGRGDEIENVVWSPTHPKLLVLCERPDRIRHEEDVLGPTTLVYNIEEYARLDPMDGSTMNRLAQSAISRLSEDLSSLNVEGDWTLSKTESDALAATLTKSLAISHAKHLTRGFTEIHGKVQRHFGSTPFSSDGKKLLCIPNDKGRRSNSNTPWNITVFDLERREVQTTLTGHTDGIMWSGFNHDNTLVGSAAWDSTFRIWSSSTGETKHVFDAPNGGQNWTAGFSGDGQLFAGTNGKGKILVWALQTGKQIASYEFGSSGGRWCRTLDWSPDGKWLAVSGRCMCTVLVVEPRAPLGQQVIQERRLSADKCEEGVRRPINGFLETTQLRFLPDGRLAFKMAGDRGLELYDFARNEKMRFCPPHSEEPQDGGWGGFEYCRNEGLIASVDADAVRFWKV